MSENDTSNRRRRRNAEETPLKQPQQQSPFHEEHTTMAKEESARNAQHEYDNIEKDYGKRHYDPKGHNSQSSYNVIGLVSRWTTLFLGKKNPLLFWFHWIDDATNQLKCCRKAKPRSKLRLLLLLKLIIFPIKIFFLHWLMSSSWSKLVSSPVKLLSSPVATQLNIPTAETIPMIIPMLDFGEYDRRDIGGWKYNRRLFQPPVIELSRNLTIPDFGGLHILRPDKQHLLAKKTKFVIKKTKFVIDEDHKGKLPFLLRKIKKDDEEKAEEHWMQYTDNGYYNIHYYDEWPEDIEDDPQKNICRFPNWHKVYKPSCNKLHELSTQGILHKTKYMGHGSFRDAWVWDHPIVGTRETYQTTLKSNRWKQDTSPFVMMKTLNDATVLGLLTHSPRIQEIYGHCATSVWVEAMPNEVEEYVVPGEGYMAQKDLHDEDELKPQNKYTVDEKLEMVIIQAESLCDVHGFSGGVVVHDDIQIAQWMRNKDGDIKLGDFNRARVLPYDEKKNEYCPYTGDGRVWRFRSPEEYNNYHHNKGSMNDKIDVYTFGNVIYAYLTGLWVFYTMDDDEQIAFKVIKGTTPYVDPRWRTRSYTEARLVELMERCWAYDPSKRPEMFDVLLELRDIQKEHDRRKTQNA